MSCPKYSYFDSIIWQQAYYKRHYLYKVWCICPISKKGKRRMLRGVSLAGTDIHGYGYYDTRNCPVNMRVSKILVSASSKYPFLISIFYPLRVLFADTNFLTSLHTPLSLKSRSSWDIFCKKISKSTLNRYRPIFKRSI